MDGSDGKSDSQQQLRDAFYPFVVRQGQAARALLCELYGA